MVRMVVFSHAAVVLLCLFDGAPAAASDTDTRALRDPIPGGKLHVREVNINGRAIRTEIQFFKTKHGGQCWNGVGRDRKGNIYLGVSSHATNSYAYALDPKSRTMRYLGDLESNVRYGGIGGSENGKIHSPFFEGPDGGVYFHSHYGDPDKIRFGGHLWRYDRQTGRIRDLGIPIPGDTSFCISQIDPGRPFTYMMSTPRGLFVRYDFKTQRFTTIQITGMGYVRNLPVDASGRLHVLWDNKIRRYTPGASRWQTLVRNADTRPGRGFGATCAFTWTRDRKRVYFVSYRDAVLFSWKPTSRRVVAMGPIHPAGAGLHIYNIHLSSDETKAYFIGGDSKGGNKGFYMFDLNWRKSYKLFSINDIIAHEAGTPITDTAFVDFTGYGGVTGDDGTMYTGFHGLSQAFVALVAIRVGPARTQRRSSPAPRPSSMSQPAAAVRSSNPSPAATQPAPGGVSSPVSGVGVVQFYKMADRADLRDPKQKYLPMAYWVRLRGGKGGGKADSEVILYVDAKKTLHDPPLGRFFVAGQRLRYWGVARSAKDGTNAFVDTSQDGGQIETDY